MWSRIVAFIRMPLPFLFAACILGGAGLYYYAYVSHQAGYLTQRNLRLLHAIGGHIETSMASDATTLESFLRVGQAPFEATLPDARKYIPAFGRLEQVANQGAAPDRTTTALDFHDALTGKSWFVGRSNRLEGWSNAPTFRIALAEMLGQIFSEQVPAGVFDTVLLATTDGQVLYQHGATELPVHNLKALSFEPLERPRDPGKAGTPADAGPLARSVEVQRTDIAGVPYRVFAQPCCRSVRAADPAASDSGWLVVGLTAEAKVSYRSLALTSSGLVPLVLLVTALVFAWPFLKFALVGARERLRVIDVAVLGLCAFMGTALVTLLCLDIYAARDLGDEMDWQLEEFSAQLRRNFADETAAARSQLQRLATDATRLPGYTPWSARSGQALREQIGFGSNASLYTHLLRRDTYRGYQFEWFFLIDPRGWQAQKWAAGSFQTPNVSVAGRDYFSHWASHDAGQQDRYYMQSVRSLTTGRKQAVLSTPTTIPGLPVAGLTIPMISLVDPVVVSRFHFAVIDDEGAVLFHSDQQHNLEENLFTETDRDRRLRAAVAARRAETMDIRYWGDEYRAHVAPLVPDETGTPRGEASAWLVPWSIVTMYEKTAARTVHVEWLATALVFLCFYVALFAMPIAVVLVLRRGYVVPWLWPDRRRVRDYRAILIAGSLFAASLAGAILTLRDVHLLATMTLVPVLMWILTYVVLARPGRGLRGGVAGALAVLTAAAVVGGLLDHGDWMLAFAVLGASACLVVVRFLTVPQYTDLGWTAVARPYTLAAGALLVTSAVLPMCGFFRLAHDVQLEAFIKSRQLRTARALHAQNRRGAAFAARQAEDADVRTAIRGHFTGLGGSPNARWGDYSSVWWGTSAVAEAPGACRLQAPGASFHDSLGDGLPGVMEAVLPYAFDESVEVRELLHNQSSEGSWDWHRTQDEARRDVLTLHVARFAEGETINLQTTLPGVTDRWSAWAEQAAYVAVMPIVLALTVWGTVRFIARRVFLIDLKAFAFPPSTRADVTGGQSARADERRLRREGRPRLPEILLDERADDAVRRVWDELAPPGEWLAAAARPDFDLDQVLDRVAARLSDEYGSRWKACSPDEKVVLGQLATEGIVNGAARHPIQDLMARGLLRRAPNLVVSNETFRRFLRAQEQRSEVTAGEQGQEASTWELSRWPLLAVVVLAVVFFATTQEVLFDETVGLVLGLTGGLPALLSLIGSVLPGSSAEAKRG